MLMKRILPLVTLFALAVASCQNNKNAFTLTLADSQTADGTIVEVLDYFATRPDSVCATGKFQDGKAIIEGNVDTPFVAALMVAGNFVGLPVIIEPGEIFFSVDTLYGTHSNDRLFTYNRQMMSLQLQAMMQLEAETKEVEDESKREQVSMRVMRQHMQDIFDLNMESYAENGDNLVGAFVLSENVVLALTDESMPNIDLDSIVDNAAPAVRNFRPLRRLLKQLNDMRLSREGQKFLDFDGIDYATGKETTLSAMIKGKVAVVDFWASWCGPCREEIERTLKPLYEKYKNRGVVVLGVDISDEMEKHDAAVKQMGITYPQLIDNSADNHASVIYGISSIPHIMIIAADGTILRRGLRGADVEAAVQEAIRH